MNNNMVSPTSQTGPRPKAETSTSQGPTEGPQAAETAPANSDQQNRQLPVAGTEISNVPAPGPNPNPSSSEQLDHSNATPYPTETGRTPRSKPDGTMFLTLRDLPAHALELILSYLYMPPYLDEVDPMENFLIALGNESGFD